MTSGDSSYSQNCNFSAPGYIDIADADRILEERPVEIFHSKTDATSAVTLSNKIKDFIEQTNKEDANIILPWHKMLTTPSKQVIVVDRMHSGAKRQVTLDFGYPVLLTDVVSF